MEILSAVLTIGTLLYHIISKISESSGNSNNSRSYENHYDSGYTSMSSIEKFSNMKIDEIDTCYKSAKIQNFSIMRAEQILLSHQIKGFDISDAFIRNKCIYIKFKHSIPYNTGFNEFGSSMSINHLEANDNVIVYGFPTHNTGEKEAFKSIANEIITELSR